mmetsp:Transcript_3892/g.9430  ORF Transcript_3892/g.9430 Transcript_3892/m.9430 type:complete len:600 (-) Transcript_3892:215-2014(-)
MRCSMLSSIRLAACVSCVSLVVACPEGQGYPTNVSKTCADCVEGTWSAAGMAECTLCLPGTWSGARGAPDQSTCSKCPQGKWSSQEGSPTTSSCQMCAAGRWGGQEGLARDTECTACLPGTWSVERGATSSEVCTGCPVGKWSESLGASSSSLCIECPKGTWSKQVGSSSQASCSACPAGTWSDVRGATSLSVCKACGVGRYQPASGQSNQSVCLRCPPGTHNMGEGAVSCNACPMGSWNDAFGATACVVCPQNQWTYTTGAMREGDCSPGALHTSTDTSVHVTFQIRNMDDAYMISSRLTSLKSDFARQIAATCKVDVQAVVDIAGENATVSITQSGAVSAYVLGERASINELARAIYDVSFHNHLLEVVSAVDPSASAKRVSLEAISVQPEQFVPLVRTATSTDTSSTTMTSTTMTSTAMTSTQTLTTTSTNSSEWSASQASSLSSTHSKDLAAAVGVGAFLVLACGLTCAVLKLRARTAAMDCGEPKMRPQREEHVPQSTGPVLLRGTVVTQPSEQGESKACDTKATDDVDAAREWSEDVRALQNIFSTLPQTHDDVGDLEHGFTQRVGVVHSSGPIATPRTEGICSSAACNARCW